MQLCRCTVQIAGFEREIRERGNRPKINFDRRSAWPTVSVIIGSKRAGVINPRSQFPGHAPLVQNGLCPGWNRGKKMLITIGRGGNKTGSIIDYSYTYATLFGSYIIVLCFLSRVRCSSARLLASRNVTRFDLSFLRRCRRYRSRGVYLWIRNNKSIECPFISLINSWLSFVADW